MTTHKQVLSNKVFKPDDVLSRGEYLIRAKEFSLRGQELPQSKLIELDVVAIRSAARQRENLRQHIKNNLSNEALSKLFGVHVRTIEKVLQYYTWSHIK
jgi:hypothetical protein